MKAMWKKYQVFTMCADGKLCTPRKFDDTGDSLFKVMYDSLEEADQAIEELGETFVNYYVIPFRRIIAND